MLLTRLSQLTNGSVILATLFHGAVNTFGFTNAAATPFQRGWANAAAYGLVALVVGAAFGIGVAARNAFPKRT